jgi:hypothetical protein
MNERVNPNNKLIVDTSPKDIKQLEILKPLSTPSVGLRHKASLEKEQRLEAASRRPEQKKLSANKLHTDTEDDDDATGQPKPKEGRKKNKRKKMKNGRIMDWRCRIARREDWIKKI